MVRDVLATLLATAVNASDDGVILFAVNPRRPKKPRVEFINRAFTRLTGYGSKEPPPAWLIAALEENVAQREIYQAHDDGRAYRLECRVTPIAIDSETPTHYICVLRDRTSEEAQKSARRLARLEALWGLVARPHQHVEERDNDVLREGIRGVEADIGCLAHVEGDQLICDYVVGSNGKPGDALDLDHTLARIAIERQTTLWCDDVGLVPEYERVLTVAGSGVRSFIVTPVQTGDAWWTLAFSSTSPRLRPFDGEDRAYVELLADYFARVIDRRRKDEQLAFLAYHDALTRLPNRAAFFGRLDEAIAAAARHGRKCAVLYFDLDRFKEVNDTLGHRAGDRILQEAAHRLRRTVRKDEFVARLGGDEFGTILPEVDAAADAQEAADRIAEVLRTPFRVDDETLYLSTSIGVALFPHDGEGREALVAHADAAMYRAKQEGRARTRFYSEAIGEDLSRRRELVTTLRGALENSQLEVYYQPLVDGRSGRCLSVEALLRWRHPVRGLLESADFLESAEETHLLPELDRFVLHEVVVQREEWRRAGMVMPISLNIAYETLCSGGGLEEMMASCTFAADGLTFELTHDALRYAVRNCREALDTCAERGIAIVVDDFGGPKSTLFDIAKLPTIAFKIDRRCVIPLPHHDGAAVLFEAMREVSKALGYRLYAKGVETAEQRDWLRGRCDGMQGYAVARPMPAAQFAAWLSECEAAGV